MISRRIDPQIRRVWRREVGDLAIWQTRLVVVVAGALAGLAVVAFTWVTEHALSAFFALQAWNRWLPLIWIPAGTVTVVWLTRRFAPGAAGSGIPQVMASLKSAVEPARRGLFVSLRLSCAKFVLTTAGLLFGLSLGREGPSVQIAAGVMHRARRWLPQRSTVSPHGLLVAGGAAGIAAAFNTPLAGIMFAIEELSRKSEQRSSGLLIAAIVLAGLMGISAYGNATYFGVIQSRALSLDLLWPAIAVALSAGLAGGLFSRLLAVSIGGLGVDRASALRRRHPLVFAGACGVAIAAIGLVTSGATYGSGYQHSRDMLVGATETPGVFVLFKFIATWLTTWSGVPGGIFAPSLSIGGALGNDIAMLTGFAHAPTLIALGMVGFLAATTQAPLTSFIIVMEMVDGHGMVLSLMACALIASGVSRIFGRPLYATLAGLQLDRLQLAPQQPPKA
jgi:H+/Cl- antiporter ClcA